MYGTDKQYRFVIALCIGLIGTNLSAGQPRFTPTQICKAGIAVVMGRNPGTMKIDRVQKSVVFLSYVRADDHKRWTYKCEIQGQHIRWGADDGRWRTDPADSVITFNAEGTMLTVIERFSDGSSNKAAFSAKQLGQ